MIPAFLQGSQSKNMWAGPGMKRHTGDAAGSIRTPPLANGVDVASIGKNIAVPCTKPERSTRLTFRGGLMTVFLTTLINVASESAFNTVLTKCNGVRVDVSPYGASQNDLLNFRTIRIFEVGLGELRYSFREH
jgi:hypothetical protein